MEDYPAAPVDIVIVNYRSYDELSRCLASLESTRAEFGTLVVVDHESDLRAASRIMRGFPWIQLVERSTNEGFATGVNIGVRATRAPFVLLVNPDCVMKPGAITALRQAALDRPRVGIIGPRIFNADGTVQGSARRFPSLTTGIAGRSSWLTRRFPNNPLSRHNLPALDGSSEPLEVDWVSGACMLVRRDVFFSVNGMDERFFLYWEDADFCFRAAERGWRTLYLPTASVEHVGGASSIHVYRESLAAFHRSAFLFFRTHAKGPSRLLQPIVFVLLQARLRLMLHLHRQRLASSVPAGRR
jgi:GT2 family glycosyltransferase